MSTNENDGGGGGDGGDDGFMFNIEDENFNFDEDEDAMNGGDDFGGFGFGNDDDDDDGFLYNFAKDDDANEKPNDQQKQSDKTTDKNVESENKNNPDGGKEEEEEEEEQGIYLPLPPKKPRLVLPSQSKEKPTVNTLIDDIQSFTPESIPRTQMQDPKQYQNLNNGNNNIHRRRQEEVDEEDEDSLLSGIKIDDVYADGEDLYSNNNSTFHLNTHPNNQISAAAEGEESIYGIDDNSNSNNNNNGDAAAESNLQGSDEPLVTQRIPLSEQMIPGPAGGLNVKKDEKSDLGESIEDVMRPGFPYNTERDGSKKAFLSQAWVRMLHDNRMYPFGDEKANTNVRYVNKYGFLEKVPRLFVVLNEVVPLDTVNVKLKLMDPSGKISGMAPKKALDQFPEMKNGAVLSLRKVSVFNSSRTSHHLNVVPENIHKIYTNDRREGEEKEHEYVKALFMSKIENDIPTYLKNLCANIYDIKAVKKSNSANQLQDPSKQPRNAPGGPSAVGMSSPFGARKVAVQSPARKPFGAQQQQQTPQIKRTFSGTYKATQSPATPAHKKSSPVVVVGPSSQAPQQQQPFGVGMKRSPSRTSPVAQQRNGASPQNNYQHNHQQSPQQPQGKTASSYFQPATPLVQKKTQQRIIVASQKTPAVVVAPVKSQSQSPQQKKVVIGSTAQAQGVPVHKSSPPSPVKVQQKVIVSNSQRPVIVINKPKVQQSQQPVVVVASQKKQQYSPQSQQFSQNKPPQMNSQISSQLNSQKQQQQKQQKHPVIIVRKKTNNVVVDKQAQNGFNPINLNIRKDGNNDDGVIDLIDGPSNGPGSNPNAGSGSMNDDDFDDFGGFDFGDDDADIISKFIQ